jgi:hypothetical protein
MMFVTVHIALRQPNSDDNFKNIMPESDNLISFGHQSGVIFFSFWHPNNHV